MQDRKHDWLIGVLSDIGDYMKKHELTEAQGDLEVLQSTVARALGTNVIEVRQWPTAVGWRPEGEHCS